MLEMDENIQRDIIISRLADFISRYFYETNWTQIATSCGVIKLLNLPKHERVRRAQSWNDDDYPEAITKFLIDVFDLDERIGKIFLNEIISQRQLDEGPKTQLDKLLKFFGKMNYDILDIIPTLQENNLPQESDNNFVYDIAFSFAGEQREYVSKVYQILKNEYSVKVFYDQDVGIQAELWGRDLVEEFQKIYSKQSKFCLIFVSKEYKEKTWTNIERRNALVRAIQEKSEYILPARFDSTDIPGILSTIGYIDISETTPEVFSECILKKLDIPLKQKHTLTTSKVKTEMSKHENQNSSMQKLYMFRVTIKGTDANNKQFIENIEVKAENENVAKIKANKIFMIPGPQGISYKYNKGPNAVVHWVVSAIQLD